MQLTHTPNVHGNVWVKCIIIYISSVSFVKIYIFDNFEYIWCNPDPYDIKINEAQKIYLWINSKMA